ncbi:glycoside hydrolase family 2 protein [Promicromonospora sp. NPDC052451]|uniref:glycoside hydrolase family 2 protein n=1 Tax=Promicromonospora sp. NPDC052451 TaxID=3364407 RepID=UPI0037CBF6D3
MTSAPPQPDAVRAALSAAPQAAPAYPRPDLDRSHRWTSLDGVWELDVPGGAAPTTVPITVPFAWETAASGVGRTWLEHATYRRRIAVPAEWAGARAVLCFGAVHHHAVVRVDGAVLAEHVGGSTPFEVDLDGVLAPGAEGVLEVEVHAPADKRAIPHGKQRSIPRDDYDGVSFTPTSGIWQPVWLEARGRTYAARVTVRGESLTGFDVTVDVAGDAPAGALVTVEVAATAGSDPGAGPGAGGTTPGAAERIELVADSTGTASGRVEIAEPRLWSPAGPHLYVLTVTTVPATGGEPDRVAVTGGLRRIERRGEHLYLNDERIYLRGVLDQGYWPESGLTAPDVDTLVADLEHARALGYNLVRKHIKLEDPRWLHHADRTGMLVWAEPPAPSRFGTEAAQAFEAQIAPMVERDGNHPSIVVWGLYNEEWGLDWDIPGSPDRADAAVRAYETLHALDDTRPIVENSGWAHVRTDLVDWHYYDEDPAAWAANVAALAAGTREDFPVRLAPDFLAKKSLYGSADHPRSGLPILNSEYGAGFTSLERAWHLRWQTQELRRHDRFAGYVYTELTDVEHEMAGLLDVDRRPKDRGGLDPRDVNTETVLVVDLVPVHAGADLAVPKADLVLGVHVSHHGPGVVRGQVRAAWVPAGTPFGEGGVGEPLGTGSETVEAKPFELSPAVTVTVPPPGPVTAARLHLWLVDDGGAVRARTFVDAAPIEEPNRRGLRWDG